jgi:hypothetical protein
MLIWSVSSWKGSDRRLWDGQSWEESRLLIYRVGFLQKLCETVSRNTNSSQKVHTQVFHLPLYPEAGQIPVANLNLVLNFIFGLLAYLCSCVVF